MRQVVQKSNMEKEENSEMNEETSVNGNGKEAEYEVEQIMDMQVKSRRKCPVQFRVRWVGYTEKDDSWLPVSELQCSQLIEEFLEISGRKPEYERALEAKQKELDATRELRQGVRSSYLGYSELDQDEEEILPSGTRTRKKRQSYSSDHSPKPTPKKSAKKAKIVRVIPEKEEVYEVERILDHRTKRDRTQYLIRWKGFSSQHDSWVAEDNVKCPRLINSYMKYIGKDSNGNENESEVEAIQDMREKNGAIEYRVKWKGLSSKSDSWVPEAELEGLEVLTKFKAILDKLEQQEDWQVERIIRSRKREGVEEFFISWKGFEAKYNTWEPLANLQGCEKILSNFRNEKKKKKAKPEEEIDSDEETPAKKTPSKKKTETSSSDCRRSGRRSAASSFSEFFNE